MSVPQLSTMWSKKIVIGAVLTVGVFLLLVKLGLWQMSRGEEKQALEQELLMREQMAPISLGLALERYPIDKIAGVRVRVSVSPIPGMRFLLDNQTYQGVVGYLAYQMVKIPRGDWLLLERGFVPAPIERNRLPTVEWLQEPQVLVGRLYQKSRNPLSADLNIEQRIPYRIQNLNIEQLSQWVGQPIVPVAFQPQSINWPYPQPWSPFPLSAQKHYAYAVQWFAMAAVLVLIVLVIGYRWIKSRRQA